MSGKKPTRKPGKAAPKIDGAALLREIEEVYRKYVIVPTEAGYVALALWTVATYGIDAWTFATRMVITSPERRCGKSRVLEVAEAMSYRGFMTADTTPAVLYRMITLGRLTIFHDELDTVFNKKNDNRAEDLRGLYNAGFELGRPTFRVGNDGKIERYDTFSMAMFGAIGDIPDTIMDRSIVIRMRRRERGEQVSPLRQKDVGALKKFRKRTEAWIEPRMGVLQNADPQNPLEDRAADVWESLLSIADLAGEEWPERARIAAKELTTQEDERSVDAVGVELLRDIAEVWPADKKRLHSEALQQRLARMRDTGWDTYSYGNPITVNEIAGLLQPYEIKPKQLKVNGVNRRGYERQWFEPVWRRYLDEYRADPPE